MNNKSSLFPQGALSMHSPSKSSYNQFQSTSSNINNGNLFQTPTKQFQQQQQSSNYHSPSNQFTPQNRFTQNNNSTNHYSSTNRNDLIHASSTNQSTMQTPPSSSSSFSSSMNRNRFIPNSPQQQNDFDVNNNFQQQQQVMNNKQMINNGKMSGSFPSPSKLSTPRTPQSQQHQISSFQSHQTPSPQQQQQSQQSAIQRMTENYFHLQENDPNRFVQVVKSRISNLDLSNSDILTTFTISDIQDKVTGMTFELAERFFQLISSTIVQEQITQIDAFTMWEGEDKKWIQRLSLGDQIIDHQLEGGFPPRCLIEIFGKAGSGKTHLALQSCLTVQLPVSEGGLGGGAFYIDTESASIAISNRLHQIAIPFAQKYGLNELPLDAVTIASASTPEELIKIVCQDALNYVKNRGVKLIVIDSIANLFRISRDFDGREAKKRAISLSTIANELKRMSHDFGAVVLIINQVTALFDSSASSSSSTISNHLETVVPAMGLAWDVNCNIQIQVSRTNTPIPWSTEELELQRQRSTTSDSSDEQHHPQQPAQKKQKLSESSMNYVRLLDITRAPHLSSSKSIQFYIETSGLRGVHKQ